MKRYHKIHLPIQRTLFKTLHHRFPVMNIGLCKNRNDFSGVRKISTSCASDSLKCLLNSRKSVSSRFFCTTTSKSSSNPTDEKKLLSLCPQEFTEFLKKNKLTRSFLIWSDSEQRVVASHPELKEIEDWLNDPSNPHYKQHEAIFLNVGMRTGCLLGVFLWKINRGQAYGGIRMSPYSCLEIYLSEGLRLSKRIGVKAALSGLWVGGGKGLISEPKDRQHILPDFRAKLFYDYGDFISSLNGCFIAGLDIGVNTYDLYNVHSRTRWVICGPEDIGGSGNAAGLLGRGVICGMEAALSFLGIGGLKGLSVAVQGSSGIGHSVVSGLLERDVAQIYVTDASQKRVDDLYDMFVNRARGRLKVEKVPLGDFKILSHDCDIIAPCAIGHILTPDTIPDIKAKVICGVAHALMPKDDYAKLLEERNVTYVLEYLPNRMALVNSIYENYGRLYRDPMILKHLDFEWEHSIYVLTKKILQMASDQKITVVDAAMILANKYSEEHHPMYPGRTKIIIQDLIVRQWHLGTDFWRKRRNFVKAEGCV